MKNNKRTKAIIAVLIMVLSTLMLATAFAGSSTEGKRRKFIYL